jgi:hypothetical protein
VPFSRAGSLYGRELFSARLFRGALGRSASWVLGFLRGVAGTAGTLGSLGICGRVEAFGRFVKPSFAEGEEQALTNIEYISIAKDTITIMPTPGTFIY